MLSPLISFAVIVAAVCLAANCDEDKLTKDQLDKLHGNLKEAGCHKDATLLEFSKFLDCYVGKPAENSTARKSSSKYEACGEQLPKEVRKLNVGALQKACLTVGTDKIDGLTTCLYETKKEKTGQKVVDQYNAALKKLRENCAKK